MFRAVVDASPNGILVADADGMIVLVNRELERQFGYTRGELLGQPVELLVPDAPRVLQPPLAQGQQPRPASADVEPRGRRKDGSLFPVVIDVRPVSIDGGATIASIVDVTEQRRLESPQLESIADQRVFEQFLADLSVQLVELPESCLDTTIREALARISLQCQVERATLYRLTPAGLPLGVVSWAAPGLSPVPEDENLATQFPWARERLRAGETLAFSTLDQVPGEVDRAAYRSVGTRSALTFPLSVDARVVGAVEFSAVTAEREWPAEFRHRLRVLASVLTQVLARRQRDEALRAALAEVERLKNELQVENATLRHGVREQLGMTAVVGRSAAVCRVLEQIRQVAPTGATVLLVGETGVGKELFASQLHEMSQRRGRAMVRVNCAAIPATLIESELFGRERGAYTGALARQIGRFELADASTVFLDEIGDLPADVQVKLLRVLENGRIERLGSPQSIAVDTRVVAATHRNLEQRVVEGAFRADLFYRLNVFPIRVPPLRERLEDIPLLVSRFVEEFSKTFGKRIDTISEKSLAALQQYTWPGNIRELRNIVERAMITATGQRLTIPPPNVAATAGRHSTKLTDVEREHIRHVLDAAGWRIRGVGGAAERLGLKPTTLETRMAKLGLRRPGPRG